MTIQSMRCRTALAGALLALLAGGGCGGGSEPAGTGEGVIRPGETAPAAASAEPGLDACKLLPPGLAEDVLGATIDQKARQDSPGSETAAASSQCRYEAKSGTAVTLFVRRAPGADNSDASVAGMRETAAGGGAVEDVQGLGDWAYWVNQGSTVVLHVFWGGDRYMTVSYAGDPDPVKALEKSRIVAEHVLAEL